MFSRSIHWYKRIDWTNTLFLSGAHIAAFGGTWLLIAKDQIVWQTIVLTVLMAIAAGLGITMGYHRLFSHKTYEAHWSVKLFLLLFGAAAFQNAARQWSSDHRRHHKYVDTDRDPYNIKEGFLFAHIGWVLLKYQDQKYEDVPDLDADALVMFQEKHYVSLAVGMGLLFPTLVASLWGDPLGGFFLAGWLRIVLNEHFTFSINSFSHMFGTQPYNDGDSSRDNWFFSLFSYGEGYHNFHHKFPFDYRNGVRTHQWDPTKWTIRFLSWFGLTSELKRVPKTSILRARLKMEEKRVLQQLGSSTHQESNKHKELISTAREKFELAFTRWQELVVEYRQLKEKKLTALNESLTQVNNQIEEIKADVRHSRLVLEDAMKNWAKLCSGYGVHHSRALV